MNIIKRLLTKLENKKRALNEKNKPVSTGLYSKREFKSSRSEDVYSDINDGMRNYMLFQSLSKDDKTEEPVKESIENTRAYSNEGCSNDDDSRRHSYYHSDIGNCSYSSDDSSSSSSSDCSSSSDSSSCSND